MNEMILASFMDELEKLSFTPKLETELMRDIGIRGLAGRLMRQGKGLSGYEKKRLAHMAGLTPGQLEAALERLPRVSFLESYPISRFLTKILPLSRRRYMRGYLQRASNLRRPFSSDERDILKLIGSKEEGLPVAWQAAKAEKDFGGYLKELKKARKMPVEMPNKPKDEPGRKMPAELPPPKSSTENRPPVAKAEVVRDDEKIKRILSRAKPVSMASSRE